MEDDGDDKDDSKRKSRNLSEKKRRDQFNMLINELSSMVSSNSRKMDKSTVLKSTIAFLKSQNELSIRSRVHEIQEEWKPSFLSNEEFTHIILESVDGFIIVFTLTGQILYTSGSMTSLLAHLPTDLVNGSITLFELICEEDHSILYEVLNSSQNMSGKENQVEFSVRVRRGSMDLQAEPAFDLVHFVGYFRSETDSGEADNAVTSSNVHVSESDSGIVFVGTGRLITPQVISEVTFSCESAKSEFTSRHNLDWKFLALDSRATPIIGYVQLEVVGTSGYDYYHVDDLDKIVSCHEALMEKGEGTSCYYRFLTKGQQWVWLQTRFYISYHQWNSKPEFIVCTHRVISYVDIMIHLRKSTNECEESQDDLSDPCPSSFRKTYLEKIGNPPSVRSRSSSVHSNQSGSTIYGGNQSGFSSITPFLSADDVRSPSKYRSDTTASSTRSLSARHSDRASYQEQGSDSLSEDSFISKSTNMSVRSVRSRPSSRHHHGARPGPTSPAQASTTYVEPQFVSSMPVQPLIPGYVVGSMPPQEVIRQGGSPLTDQVKRKQQELNQLRQLMCQKEEELQQFVLAQSRYSLVPSAINVSHPYSVGTSGVSSTTQSSQILSISPLQAVAGSREFARPPASNHQGIENLADCEIVPFQFSHQQAQLLFHSPQHPPPTHQ